MKLSLSTPILVIGLLASVYAGVTLMHLEQQASAQPETPVVFVAIDGVRHAYEPAASHTLCGLPVPSERDDGARGSLMSACSRCLKLLEDTPNE
jgi:hypothetical protein